MVTRPTSTESPFATITNHAVRFYTVAAVPLYVVSQWTVIRFDLPGRQIFNLFSLLLVAAVLVRGRRELLKYRTETITAAVFAAIVVVSALVNGVATSALIRGSLPYLAFSAIALAVLVLRIDHSAIDRGLQVAAITAAVSIAAAFAQTIFGRGGFVATAQNLAYPAWWDLGRSVGLVANPGGFARLGVVWIAIAAVGRGTKTTRITLAVSGGLAIGLGVSRTSLLVALLFVAIWFIFKRVDGTQMLAWGAVAAVGAFVIVQVLAPTARSNLLYRGATIQFEANENGEELLESGEERLIYNTRVAGIRATQKLLSDRPLLGAGPGQFGSSTAFRTESEAHKEYGLPVPMGVQLDVGWAQVAGETGISGLVAAALLLAALGMRALSKRAPAAIAIVLLLAVSTLTGPGITDISFTVVALWWFAASMQVASEPARRTS